jgi:hypothetical protein
MIERMMTDYEISVPVHLQGLDLFFPRSICVANYGPLSRNTDVIVTAFSGLRASLILRFKHKNIYELTLKNTPPSIQNKC